MHNFITGQRRSRKVERRDTPPKICEHGNSNDNSSARIGVIAMRGTIHLRSRTGPATSQGLKRRAGMSLNTCHERSQLRRAMSIHFQLYTTSYKSDFIHSRVHDSASKKQSGPASVRKPTRAPGSIAMPHQWRFEQKKLVVSSSIDRYVQNEERGPSEQAEQGDNQRSGGSAL